MTSAELNTRIDVQLVSGGQLTLTVDVELLSLEPDDRAFVFELLDRVKRYDDGLATLRAFDEMAMNAHGRDEVRRCPDQRRSIARGHSHSCDRQVDHFGQHRCQCGIGWT